jgi:hypothetical protein
MTFQLGGAFGAGTGQGEGYETVFGGVSAGFKLGN